MHLYTLENVSINVEKILSVLKDHNQIKNKENYDEFLNLYNIQISPDKDKAKLYKENEKYIKSENFDRIKIEKVSESNVIYEMEFLLDALLCWRYGDKYKFDKINFKPIEKAKFEFTNQEDYIKYSKELILSRCWLKYLHIREIVKDDQNINLTIKNVNKRQKFEGKIFLVIFLCIFFIFNIS